MGVVELALRRPFTFLVAAVLVLLLGVVTIESTPTDVFPNINIPVAAVLWAYTGASPDDMDKRIVTVAERQYSAAVSDIQHIESESLRGHSTIKIFFQPGANINAGVAQLTAASQTLLKLLPPGMTPPLIIQFSASSVPIVQVELSSKTLGQAQLYDIAQNTVRVQLATISGAAVPSPYGGKARQIMVDLDTKALQGKGLSPVDVISAINSQSLILPAGSAKMGDREYFVSLNSSPTIVSALNNIPIKEVRGAMVYVRDVAFVHDGFAVQTSAVNVDGRRAVLLTVLKSGSASTLAVVDGVKALLPRIRSIIPKAVNLKLLADQSIFVRASISGVVREAVIAAVLTALMILLFLGSWRSTLIVAMSIPLSILASIVVLGATGQTLNVMTLGGLALAVGILVDNAIVVIENIYRNLGLGKPLRHAILDGTQQIASPTLVATLGICIVFVPILFLGGAPGSLFKPMALSVVWAMIASYLLSRTFVPVVVHILLRKEPNMHARGHEDDAARGDVFWRAHLVFNRYFEMLLAWYREQLNWALHHRKPVLGAYGAVFLGTLLMVPFVGENFFPTVDAGSFRLHVRAPAGTRIEQTEKLYARVEDQIRRTIPAGQLDVILDDIGLPFGGVNFAYSTTGSLGPSDGEILVTLKPEHDPTASFVERLRQQLPQLFPQLTFFFQPADITTQILNFGLPAPIDIKVSGVSRDDYDVAMQIARQVKRVPGAADVHVHQVINTPEIHVSVDRERAAELGINQQAVANDLLISLSGSGQRFPNFWLDPRNGVEYLLAAQTPQYAINSIPALKSMPVVASGTGKTELLSNLATLQRRVTPEVINHYNIMPTFDVYANVQGRDLGGVARDIDAILARLGPHLPHGTTVVIRGQVESMITSFMGLGGGLIFSIVLIYMLLVVNYQALIDPIIIITALPGALCGIVWMLFVTQTVFSVPALMGAIMCIGVSTANSILVVTFANDRRLEGDSELTAAMAAGCTRLRPVLMTAGAMIIGMLPMALGLGEGGEQNAPLGRAVIGGLSVATVSTLLFVPVIYSILRKKSPALEQEVEPHPSGSGPDGPMAHSPA